MPPIASDLITNALIEAEWLAQGEVPEAQDANFVLGKINDLLDEWAARKVYVYSTVFQLFTLVPNLSPHTMGPTGTFVIAQRPVRIESAALILNSGPVAIDSPIINIRDHDWWAGQRDKNIATNVPTDLFPSYDWPNASLFFWPVPSVAAQVRLETWSLLSQLVSINDPLSLPPAYRKAITLTIAEELSGPRSGDPKLALSALKARRAVQGNNDKSPRMSTCDPGQPESGKRRPQFNWETGNLTG